MKAVWTIARRELKAMLDHPTGYILLVVFLVVNDFLFFRQAYVNAVASLRPMLDLLPWVLLFLVPAVTMRALAEDLRSGTLEVVLAQPVSEHELLLGKYLGQVLFLWLALALTFPVPLGLSFGADLHAGVVVAQYVGAAFLVAGLAGVGLWASSVTRNQVTAFILGVAVMFVLVLVGLDPLIVGLPPVLAAVAQSLGVLSHFQNIARGVIDLRDVIYFLTLAAIFLTFAYLALMGRKLASGGGALKRLRAGTVLLTVTLVVVNLFGRRIGGRLDLTPGNAYTLSPATKRIVRGLDDLVTVTLFTSKELPSQVALLERDVDDLLSDLRSAAGGNVRVVIRHPDTDDDAKQAAQQLGVPEIQFNVYGESEFQLKSGYFGLAVQYADGAETIPFIQRTDDLEYRIAADIRQLTRQTHPVVGFVQQVDPRDPGGAFRTLQQSLRGRYEVQVLSLSDSSASIPDSVAVLVLAGSPIIVSDSQLGAVRGYLRHGHGALVMARGAELQQQALMARPMPVGWNRVLGDYGIRIRPDLVYDLSSNEAVSMPSGMGGLRVLVNYPFWIRAASTGAAVVNRDVEAVTMPWASSLAISDSVPEGAVVPLFTTSRAGGVETGQIFISPQQEFPQDSLARRVVAALANPRAAGDTAAPAGRLVVVGNTDFVSDRFVQNGGAGLTFALNAIDWLAQDEDLISIRAKDRTPPPLVFESSVLRDLAKYGNVAGVPLLLVVFAVVRLGRRRQLTRRTFGDGGDAPPAEAGAQ